MRFPVGNLSLIGLALACGLVVGLFLKVENRHDTVVGGPPGPARELEAGRGVRSRRNPGFPARMGSDSRDRSQALEDLAAMDHAAAILELDDLSDASLRSSALAAIARGWAKSDPEAAGAWVAGLESEEDGISAALGLIPVWADVNPNNCFSWATALDSGPLREVSLTQLADAWVSRNPQEALGRYLALSPETGSERGLHVIAAQWALDSPEAATAYLTNAVNQPRHEEFLETALVSLSNVDPLQAWNHATAFKDPERTLNVRAMALESLAGSKPREAIQLAESAGNDPELLKGIARGWASTDEAATTAWIRAMKDQELAKSLLDEIPGK